MAWSSTVRATLGAEVLSESLAKDLRERSLAERESLATKLREGILAGPMGEVGGVFANADSKQIVAFSHEIIENFSQEINATLCKLTVQSIEAAWLESKVREEVAKGFAQAVLVPKARLQPKPEQPKRACEESNQEQEVAKRPRESF